MSLLGRVMLGLTSYAVIILMGAILMRAIELKKARVAHDQDQDVEGARMPLPAGLRKFQPPRG